MRKEMNYKKVMKMINVTGENEKEKINEMIERMIWDLYNERGEQLDHMNAKTYGGRTLKSYSTLVAYFDGVNVYELGYYSRTTSKQVTRFADYHGANIIRISNPSAMLMSILDDDERERINGGYTTLDRIFPRFYY